MVRDLSLTPERGQKWGSVEAKVIFEDLTILYGPTQQKLSYQSLSGSLRSQAAFVI
jgi:hypothetical protein